MTRAITYFSFLLSSLLISCSEHYEISKPEEMHNVTVNITTKAHYQNPLEVNVKNINILVFDFETGMLERNYHFVEKGPVYVNDSQVDYMHTVKVESGIKTFVFIANTAPTVLSHIKTISDFENNVWYSGYYDMGELLMICREDNILVNTDINLDIVKLKRMFCMFHIYKITNNLPQEYGDIKIRLYYLKNAPKYYGGAPYPLEENSFWALDDFDRNGGGRMTQYLDEIAKPIRKGESQELGSRFFFSFPNNAEPSGSPDERDFVTKFIIEAIINRRSYYYTISFENTEANHKYTINELIISNLGSLSPDQYAPLPSTVSKVEKSIWDE